MATSNSKQRLFEIMGKIDGSFKPKLNESGAFNSAGEPLMTHSQYRDYSEPAEDDFEMNEMPKFGGQNVSQDTYDELQYDKSNMEQGMADAFKTPPDYQMKNNISAGETIELTDGDKVQIKGIDANTGNIKVRVFHGADTLEKYKKWGVPVGKPYFDITWSPKQFDTIVGNSNENSGEPMNELANWGKTRANPAYTHFATLRNINPAVDGKIVNGWEYKGYDPAELRSDKKHYFFQDIIDSQINPKNINIAATKYLQKRGIDPYDYKNWYNNGGGNGDEFTDLVYTM